ncbi:Glypican-5 [Oryzias melastigma]|uniref:Glypican-5 n=1 Tax=Oryzias melastigma TaxID=30732 RepID=A0A834CA27_ORYME|nr:Glypican-5 [Oryzias melastigma]
MEIYVSKVAEPGLYGQRQNPEFKVRSMDPRVVEVKERLEHFNQETLERFPDLEELEEFGSGEEDGSTEECDDEDGCQNSGDGQEGNPHGGESIYTESTGRQPEENPSKPPPVRPTDAKGGKREKCQTRRHVDSIRNLQIGGLHRQHHQRGCLHKLIACLLIYKELYLLLPKRCLELDLYAKEPRSSLINSPTHLL